MKICKKLVSAIAIIAMLVCCLPTALAAEVPEGYDFNVYVDFEAFTLGWGFVMEPTVVPAHEGETVAAVTLRALENAGLAVNYSGSATSGFNLKGVECHETQANIPAYLMAQFDIYPEWAEENLGDPYGQWTGARADANMLSVYDFSSFSGWMFAVDDVAASVGADGAIVAEGQMIRWEFTVYGWGMDCGLNDGWGMFPEFDNPAEGVMKSDVFKAYAEFKADPACAARIAEGGSAYDEYVEFINVASDITSSQNAIEQAYDAMAAASYDFNVYVDFEAFVMGWGYILEPMPVPARTGETVAAVTIRALDMAGLAANYSGSATAGFYLRGVECDKTQHNIPQYIMDQFDVYPAWAEANMGGAYGQWTGTYTDDGMLSEMEYSTFAGWMFAVDDASAATGADGLAAAEGQMIRWMFSVYGWGMDCGLNDGWGMFPEFNNPAEGVLRSTASKGYAELAADPETAAMMAEGGTAHEAYVNYVSVISNIASSQAEIDAAYAALLAALTGGQSAMLGDADCNGTVNFGDISAAYMNVLGYSELTAQGVINADINGDGMLNFGDISDLYLYLLGE